MIKACVFDLDGTLLNTLIALSTSISLTMERYNLGAIDIAHTKLFVGNGARRLVENALKFNNYSGAVSVDEITNTYNEIFKLHCDDGVVAYDGMKEALKELKKRGLKLAVLTNKSQDRADNNISTHYGDDFFDIVYGEREGVPLKPDPKPLLNIMSELSVKPDEVLYFGDTKTDMLTGKSAGAFTVGVLWGYRDRAELEEYHADVIIEKPSEILGLIK